jgi:hypothetical protein
MSNKHLYWIIGAIVVYWLYNKQTTTAGNSTGATLPITTP